MTNSHKPLAQEKTPVRTSRFPSFLRWIVVLGLLSATIWQSRSPLDNTTGALAAEHHMPGVLLVRLQPWASHLQAIDLLPATLLTEAHEIRPLGVQRWQVPSGQETGLLETLRSDPRVDFAEYDYAIQATEVITPNDPEYSRQWALAKIQAPPAWGITVGVTGTVIAVLDSGIQTIHPDLADKLWVNEDEIPLNWIDDDGNGKVDDRYGWHFFHVWNGTEYIPRENARIEDDNGHGTHVSGIAAAATNNATGIAGVAWEARILPVKVLDQYGAGWYSDIAAGIVYAAQNGARVINLSAGGTEPSQTLQAAVDYAYQLGSLVIAAAGNDGKAGVLYPAAYPNVLAVAATDQQDNHASFSNFGPEIDLAAPGLNIYSTWYKGNYRERTGTSMATPHVAGIAALVWSIRPSLVPGQVAGLLAETSDDIETPGFDHLTGWGRVNAFQALLHASSLPGPFISRLPLIRR